MKRTKVAVLIGSGRSATSAVANGLHQIRWSMGDNLIGPGPGNPRGHFEHRPLVDLNDLILRSMGHEWFNPPPQEDDRWRSAIPEWLPSAERYLEERLRAHYREFQFGMKDPRVTVTWPIWACAFAALSDRIEPILVLCHRNPDLAAASMAHRDGMPHDDARAIVDAYQHRAIQIVSGLWFPLPATT